MANVEVEDQVEVDDLGALIGDIFSGAIAADPFPVYAELRERAPVYRSPAAWLISRYDDAAELLRDHERLSNDLTLANPEAAAALPSADPDSVLVRVRQQWLVFRDPPAHTRLRGLVNRAFTPRAVAELRGFVGTVVDGVIDDMLQKSEIDFVNDFAYPLPVAVISHMLRVPEHEAHLIRRWTPKIQKANDTTPTPEENLEADVATSEFIEYLHELLAQRRGAPGDDLLSVLVAAHEDGDRLCEEELIAMVVVLLIAGHETTVSVASNGLLALLQQRDQWDLLCREPDLAPSAAEELLRHGGPVQFVARIAKQPFELRGQQISKGDLVMSLVGGANRDPERFPDPDRLDIRRSPNRHLAFSGGIHFCVGAGLARLELELLLRGLAKRAPDIALAGEPTWRDGAQMRSVATLPVRVGGAGAA